MKILSIAIISAVILAAEILFTRLFSALFFYHFTFFAISAGILGLSLGAIVVARYAVRYIPLYAYLGSICFPLSIIFINRLAVIWGTSSIVVLILSYIIIIAPFFVLGILLAALLLQQEAQFSKLYSVDLFAAGLIAVIFPFGLEYWGVPTLFYFLGFLLLVTGFILSRQKRVLISFLILHLLILMTDIFCSLTAVVNPAMQDKKLVWEKWTNLGRVGLYQSDSFPWLQENVFEKIAISKKLIIIDAWATTPVIPAEARESQLQFKLDLSASAFQVTERNKALIIGAGGGRDVLLALKHGFSSVDAVEINPAIAQIMFSTELEYSGAVYKNEKVKLWVQDGRKFLKNSQELYDNIQLTLVDTFASTSAGAFALSENNLYTVEAVRSYIQHLKANGVLAMSRWTGAESIRLFFLLKEAARREGIENFSQHLAVFVSRLAPNSQAQAAFFIFRKTPFDDQAASKLRKFSLESKLPLFHDPLIKKNTMIAEIAFAPNSYELAKEKLKYELRPPTDSWPFFFFRPSDFFVSNIISNPKILFLVPEYTPVGIFLITLVISGLALLFTTSPAQISFKPKYFYFSFIGLGFMFIEMPWVQRASIEIGSPTIAVSTILGALLLGSGLGARIAHRLRFNSVFIGLAGPVTIVFGELIFSTFKRLEIYSLQFSVIFLGALLFLIGIPLGIYMPLGIGKLCTDGVNSKASAWSINAAFSVMGTVGAMLTALFAGFGICLAMGILFYFCAWIWMVFFVNEQRDLRLQQR